MTGENGAPRPKPGRGPSKRSGAQPPAARFRRSGEGEGDAPPPPSDEQPLGTMGPGRRPIRTKGAMAGPGDGTALCLGPARPRAGPGIARDVTTDGPGVAGEGRRSAGADRVPTGARAASQTVREHTAESDLSEE